MLRQRSGWKVANGLTALTDAYRASYREAYRCSAGAQRRWTRSAALWCARTSTRAAPRGADRRARAQGRGGTRGRAADVFLGGLTCQGKVCRFDSVDALCPRVYELCDSYGLAAPVLRRARDAALEAGTFWLAATQRGPRNRASADPRTGPAFVTTGEGVRYEALPPLARRRDGGGEADPPEKAHLRFIRRVRRALEEEAVASLRRAKRGHDALEALYRPCVDFDAVGALCDAEIARIGAYPV